MTHHWLCIWKGQVYLPLLISIIFVKNRRVAYLLPLLLANLFTSVSRRVPTLKTLPDIDTLQGKNSHIQTFSTSEPNFMKNYTNPIFIFVQTDQKAPLQQQIKAESKGFPTSIPVRSPFWLITWPFIAISKTNNKTGTADGHIHPGPVHETPLWA